MSAAIRRRRVLAGLGLVVVGALVAISVRTMPSHKEPSSQTSASTSFAEANPPPNVAARVTPTRLPEPVSGEAVVAHGARLLVIGGLGSSQTSFQSILSIDPTAGTVASAGSLAQPIHDAAAAAVNRRIFVLGGGTSVSTDSVEAFVRGGAARTLGSLPTPRSDLAAVTVDNRVYVVGGYDGTSLPTQVLATRDGVRFSTVADLAVAVRDPAVATLGESILVFGGETATGSPTNAIQRIDPRSGQVRVVGHLPAPIDHASAATLDGNVYVLGGYLGGGATHRVWRFDPATGSVHRAGRLPYAVADSGAATLGGNAYLVGGIGTTGNPLDTVAVVALR